MEILGASVFLCIGIFILFFLGRHIVVKAGRIEFEWHK